MISIYPLSRQCAVCRALVNVGEDHPGRLPASIEAKAGIDGRPGYENLDWLVRAYWVEECPQCGHVAPNIAVDYPEVMRSKEARDAIYALSGHAKAALRLVVVAGLFGDSDPRETGFWLLRAAWIDEAQGFAEGARSLRLRAANALESALWSGSALSTTRLRSSMILAECLRIGGAFDRALEHCARGARFNRSAPNELRRQLLFLASCVLAKRNEPLTCGEAEAGCNALTDDERKPIVEAIEAARARCAPISLRPERSFRHPQLPSWSRLDAEKTFALDFMDADLMIELLRDGRIGVWEGVVARPNLVPALLGATDHEDAVVRRNALRAMYDHGWPFEASALEGQEKAVRALAKRLGDNDAGAVRSAAATLRQILLVNDSLNTLVLPLARAALPNWKTDISTEGALERLVEMGIKRVMIAEWPKRARTMAEVHFAASLRRCPTCGAQPKDLTIEPGSGWLKLDGKCPFCGAHHAFQIYVAEDIEQATCSPGELGDEKPSSVITPREFSAELVRLYGIGTSDARWRALTCIVELLKHADAGVGDLGEGLTKEWLLSEYDRLRAISPASREIPQGVLDLAEPPKTVGDLCEIFGVKLTAEHVKKASCGRIQLDFRGTVTKLEATYTFSVFHEQPIETWESMSGREPSDFIATLAVPAAVLDAALEKKHGKPRVLTAHRQYGPFFVGGSPNDGTCTLAWYEKTPDWAIPAPPFAIRERALVEIMNAASAGGSLADVTVADGAGIVVKHRSATTLRLELVPAMLANDLISIFQWGPCLGDTDDMHMQRWHVQKHTGENEFGAERTLPSFGARSVRAEIDGWPSGGRVTAGGLGTYAIGAKDLVRYLVIGS